MIDLKNEPVEIQVQRDPNGGYKLWVNTTEGCQLQAYRIPELTIDGNAFEPIRWKP